MGSRKPSDDGPLPTDRGAKYHQQRAGEAVAVLAAGVDYLTCTAQEPANAEILKGIGWRIVYEQAELGNDLRQWDWKGYSGITAGSAAVGVRGDGVICRYSGNVAADNWVRPVQLATHVSRIDLAVTVRLPPDSNPAAAAFIRPTARTPAKRGRSVRDAAHIETWRQGETCYLGSRESDRYGRLYNKELESKKEEYRGTWRWEVEYKGRAGTPVAKSLPIDGGQSSAVLAYVWDAFAGWGNPPVWGAGADVGRFMPPREPSNDEKRLAWLYAQVRPVIARLIQKGRREEVISALGLGGEQGG